MDAAASSTFNPAATIDDGSCEYFAGCLNPSAGNYDETADYDDGSCEFTEQPVLPDSLAVYGCMDAAASSTFNPDATIDDGTCEYFGGCLNPDADTYDANADYDDGSCEFASQPVIPDSLAVYGCMDAAASSTFNPDATIDDGSCEYFAGCLNPSAGNYNANADYDDGSCEFADQPVIPDSLAVYGCMDAAASSTFNPDATIDDGSCEYFAGCLNPSAGNYNANADYDDGSCEFADQPVLPDSLAVYGCMDAASGDFNLNATQDDGSCEYIGGCLNPDADNYDSGVLIDFDDGTCTFGDPTAVPQDQAIYGCMDAASSTFNPAATNDDGSCEYIAGCLNPAANNYDETADYDNGGCTFDNVESYVPEDEAEYFLGCMDEASSQDYNPDATYDDGNQCTYIGYCTNPLADLYYAGADYDDGSCTFNNLNAANSGEVPASSDYSFGCTDPDAPNYSPQAVNDDGSCAYVGGCLNPNADNYDPDAIIDYDDGSCEFQGVAPTENPNYIYAQGCMDAGASNYDDTAQIDDGSCEYIGGCLNPAANNYDEDVLYDNGTCTFDNVESYVPEDEAEYVLGCMDDAANNYLASATYDDGQQCIYEGGCMDDTATNHNPEALYDDGSCQFGEGEYDLEDFESGIPYVGGCLNPIADIYDANADYDDGSCTFVQYEADNVGCMIFGSSNYDSGATIAGECIGLPEVQYDLEELNVDAPVYVGGCLNPDADIYNEDADYDDGSCTFALYEEENIGCMVEGSSNYDSGATIAGECIELPEVQYDLSAFEDSVSYAAGCINPLADNFNADADYDDESCIFSGGCLQQGAQNYDPDAPFDDGSCIFNPIVFEEENATYGCIYPDATNYDKFAEVDNGTCTFVGCVVGEEDPETGLDGN
jgi:hypothetical protein